jgi:hypothetical protein
MIEKARLLTTLFLVFIITVGKSQTLNWNKLALTLDSAAFEKTIDPKSFSITPTNLTEIEKWGKDDKINGDSLFNLLTTWNTYPTPKQTGIICKFSTQIDTNYTVPYFVYVPKNYDPKQKNILLVYYKDCL